MAKRDYYESLGVSKNATADEIKKAHRKLVRQYHPDVKKNDKQAEEKFKEVQEAYDVLSDPTKRQNYDQFGHAGVGAGQAGEGGDPFEAFRRAQAAAGHGGAGGAGGRHQWRAGPNVSVEDFEAGDAGQFSDIFEQLFGRGGMGAPGARGAGGRARGGRQQQAEPERGADIEHEVTLTFDQAAKGTTLPLQIDRDGKRETIEVKIPAGVKDGSRIRLKGRGQHSAYGEPGDLYIITRVLPHDYFRRDGLDIYVEVPISVWDALLGTKVEVPTLDGSVQLTIPAGTSSGAKLRIKGHGIARGSEKGDEYVTVKILVPKKLSDEDKAIVRQLAERNPVDVKAATKW